MDHGGDAKKVHARMHVAFHGGAPIIVLDETLIASLGHGNGLGESLFFEIANGVIVGVGNKVFNSGARARLLEQVHEFGAVPLDLVVAVDGAKGNFRKAFFGKGAVANAPNDFFVTVAEGGIVCQNGQGRVASIQDQARNIGSRHFGQLFGKETLQANELDHTLGATVISDSNPA